MSAMQKCGTGLMNARKRGHECQIAARELLDPVVKHYDLACVSGWHPP